jgi:hypothetical protein
MLTRRLVLNMPIGTAIPDMQMWTLVMGYGQEEEVQEQSENHTRSL